MIKRFQYKTLIFFSIIGILASYFFLSLITESHKFDNLKSLLNKEQKIFIKKYIFPYKMISDLENEIVSNKYQTSKYLTSPTVMELQERKSGNDIQIKEKTIDLSNNLTLKKYRLISGFYGGINNHFPGSGYIDFYENNIFVLSSRGVFAYKKNLDNDEEDFKQINNNIDEFIGLNQFKKEQWFSLKDILIFKEKVFVSYTEEIKEDCWNTSIIYGDLSTKNIKFKRLFSPKECVHSINNIDNEFNAIQSGGRIISFDDNHILLSIGDYRSRFLAQDKKSINGKVIKINIYNNKYEIISMGHRNPQGLYFDKENNFILETEHGPQGGDELNLIKVNKINENTIQNYGWAISSAGEHYGGRVKNNKMKYEKYPLYNSHSEHGFIEPLKSFVPSIGISEIVKIQQNKYVLSSMKDKSLYFFELDNEKKIINLDRLEVFERVRDLTFRNNQLYLFMEDTASIGIININ
jgi:hypothetical protein